MKNILVLLAGLVVAATSCEDKYLNDGGTHSNTSHQTPYEYIKGNAHHEFDTTILIIDHFGLEDEVNSCGTFFAFNDFSVRTLLNRRMDTLNDRLGSDTFEYGLEAKVCYYNVERDTVDTPEEAKALLDSAESYKHKDYYTIHYYDEDGDYLSAYEVFVSDSLVCGVYNDFTADDLRMYMFSEKIVNNKELLTKYPDYGLTYANRSDPKIYECQSTSHTMAISTQETTNRADYDLYQDGTVVVETYPWFLALTIVRGEGLDDPNEDWEDATIEEQLAERDVSGYMRTSDILCTKGDVTVLHVPYSGLVAFVGATDYDSYSDYLDDYLKNFGKVLESEDDDTTKN